MWRFLVDAHEHAVRRAAAAGVNAVTNDAESSRGGRGGRGGALNNNNEEEEDERTTMLSTRDGNDDTGNGTPDDENIVVVAEEEDEDIEENDEESEDVNAEEMTIRSDLQRVFRKMKPMLPYISLFSVVFFSFHWKILCVIVALFAWHLKTSESLVQEIAKKEAFIRKNVVRDFVHCVCVSYAFLFLVPTKLDDADESPKMWRRILAKTPTRNEFTAWEGLFEIVAINLNARFMFDALKCLCVLTTSTATLATAPASAPQASASGLPRAPRPGRGPGPQPTAHGTRITRLNLPFAMPAPFTRLSSRPPPPRSPGPDGPRGP